MAANHLPTVLMSADEARSCVEVAAMTTATSAPTTPDALIVREPVCPTCGLDRAATRDQALTPPVAGRWLGLSYASLLTTCLRGCAGVQFD